MHAVHSLTGHKNKNWPIKSSFFMGRNCAFISFLWLTSQDRPEQQLKTEDEEDRAYIFYLQS